MLLRYQDEVFFYLNKYLQIFIRHQQLYLLEDKATFQPLRKRGEKNGGGNRQKKREQAVDYQKEREREGEQRGMRIQWERKRGNRMTIQRE